MKKRTVQFFKIVIVLPTAIFFFCLFYVLGTILITYLFDMVHTPPLVNLLLVGVSLILAVCLAYLLVWKVVIKILDAMTKPIENALTDKVTEMEDELEKRENQGQPTM